eukprot:gene8818-11907_t
MGSPTQIRLGGGGSSDFLFTKGLVCDKRVNGVVFTDCITANDLDIVMDFITDIGATLVLDFNIRPRLESGEWDSSNTELLLDYLVEKNYKLSGIQLGNEMELFIRQYGLDQTGYQSGRDMVKFKQILTSYKYANTVVNLPLYGPQYCCDKTVTKDGSFIKDFAAQAKEVVAAITLQHYPIHSCDSFRYFAKDEWSSFVFLATTQDNIASSVGNFPVPPIILTEIASAYAAGCPGLSDRYVDVFPYMYQLSATAKSNIVQLFRQDIYGGNYELVSVVNWWSKTKFSLTPDYFVSILWKQLIGNRVLRSVQEQSANFDAHFWCSSGAWSGTKGVPVLTYVNTNNFATYVSVPFSVTNRIEYVLTSTEHQTTSVEPPSLYNTDIYLNGNQMTVQSDGSIPEFPYAGKLKTDDRIVVPSYSVGFIVFESIGAIPACA